VRNPGRFLDCASNMVTNPENPVRINYSHTSVPDHVADLHKQAENPQAPREGKEEKAVSMQRRVVYESGHAQDEIEQLPENLQQPAKELIAALGNPKHALRSAAEQVVRVFAVASEKGGKSKVPEVYAVVATLEEAAEKIGVPPEAIMTPRDITTEFHLTRSRINEWRRSGPHGQPHITPLPVRLSGDRGAPQLLFLREAVERVVADPPKPGPPRKS
jgi:hypothetical protein